MAKTSEQSYCLRQMIPKKNCLKQRFERANVQMKNESKFYQEKNKVEMNSNLICIASRFFFCFLVNGFRFFFTQRTTFCYVLTLCCALYWYYLTITDRPRIRLCTYFSICEFHNGMNKVSIRFQSHFH